MSEPAPSPPPSPSPLESRDRWRRALAFVTPFRRAVAVIVALTLVAGGLTALEPLVLKSLFDALGGGPRAGSLARPLAAVLGWLLAIGLAREAIGAVTNWLAWRTRLGVHDALLDATVGRLQLLPLGFHRSESVGALMTRLDRGIQGFVAAITELAFRVLPALVYLGVAVAVMVRLDWRLALVVLAFAPLPALVAMWSAPVQTRRERSLLDAWARIYSRFNEVLSGIVTVKSFAMEDEERRRFLRDVRSANRTVIRGVRFDAGVGAGQNLVVTISRVASLALGALLVARGQMSMGTLVAFLGYLAGLFAPVAGLSSAYRTIRTGQVSLAAIFELLDVRDQVPDADDAEEPGALRGAVEFRGVKFRHHERDAPILDGIDLAVAAGEQVAIVGPSGAGKTTLMALLQRFYDPLEGTIFVDGKDVRRLKQRSLRRNIGVVLQDALLFNETVRDNLAYGRPGASQAELEAAARAAQAEELIARLPDGWDTLVGERGCRLSAGERQRLAIARALVKDPPLVILDEATAALDAETESLVQRALERLIAGRTTFTIAHRLATVVRAHRIVVLDRGRIIESGTHVSLVRSNGYYASLVRRQTAGLLDVD